MTEAMFMEACQPPVAAFYAHVLALAKQRGFVIDWTTNGFAVRVALALSGNPAGFVYGAPNGSFEFYFGYLDLDAEAALALRKQLLSFGVFREAGQKTLRASVATETIPQLQAAYDLILDEVGRMRQGDA
jgi:hypothetical protein